MSGISKTRHQKCGRGKCRSDHQQLVQLWPFVVPSQVLSETFPLPRYVFIYTRSFVASFLRAGVQPTLDSSVETFMSVQCASPGRGGELVGESGVYARCVGWRKA